MMRGVVVPCGATTLQKEGGICMTVNEAIARCDEMTGDGSGREAKLRWLSDIESMIYEEIVRTHEGAPDRSEWKPIAEEDGERELFAQDPYGELYVFYLMMRFHLLLQDMSQYNNAAALFAAAYTTFADWYNRTHIPLSQGSITF